MDPATLTTVGTGIGLGVGSAAASAGGLFASQEKQHKHDKEMQERQWAMNRLDTIDDRKYQYRMDSTRYQRTVSDLRAAGLNPILAVNGMSPGTSGNFSARSVSAPTSVGLSGFKGLDFSAISALSQLEVNKSLANRNNSEAKYFDAIAGITEGATDIVNDGRGLYTTAKDLFARFGSWLGSKFIDSRKTPKSVSLAVEDVEAELDRLIRLEGEANSGKSEIPLNGSGPPTKRKRRIIEIRKFAP